MGKIFKSEIFKTVMSYLLIIVCVILIRIFFIDPVRVDGGAMDTTLANGQIMILNKIVYKRNDIKRFDIVVIDEGDKAIIKRVIGLPGETVEYKDNKLYINGQETEDPYPSTETDDFSITDIGHTKVPGDCYFVMGDNRANSSDARYWENPYINKKYIKGIVQCKVYPHYSKLKNN